MLWISFLKHILPKRLRNWLWKVVSERRIKSIRDAIREQKLLPIYHQLTENVPDITHQYTSFDLDSEYIKTKVRAQHAFQIALTSEALQSIHSSSGDALTIVDIGDSAGTHLQYIKELYHDRNLRCLSVNMDSEAVGRIREKGMEAICARAEDLPSLSIEADLFLSFEMLEHLMNPCGFLQGLSANTGCKVLVVTVPYLARSRVGLPHIRYGQKRSVNPEITHIFELSPEDWRLIFLHSGWSVQAERIYLQYPRRSIFRPFWKWFWRHYDFEGFYGAILKPDKSWSSLYNGW